MSIRREMPLLFNSERLDSWLEVRKRQATEYIRSIEKARFLNASDSDMVEHACSKYSVTPIDFFRDNATAEEPVESSLQVNDYGRPIAVPAHVFTIRIPFNGLPALWNMQPNFFTSNPPAAKVRANRSDSGGELLYVQKVRSGDKPDLKGGLQRELDSMEQYLRAQREMIERFSDELKGEVGVAIQRRRALFKEQEGLCESLGLPLVKREGMPDYKPLPMERVIKPLPPPPQGGYRPEPALTADQFEDILSLIRHQGRSFEQSPGSIQTLGEEALRDLLLAAINTVYKGQATGEAFRKTGKTDIRIEGGDRSAFVAECKLWRGKAHFIEGIEQLLGYLTYRDGKASLIVFNKETREREKVLAEIDAAIKDHPSFKRVETQSQDGEFRYVLKSMADESRDIRCHVFMFHMPVSTPPSKATPKRPQTARSRKRK